MKLNALMLYRREGLIELDAAFVDWLEVAHAEAHRALLAGRAMPEALSALEHSALLMQLAPLVEEFVAQQFGIADALAQRSAALQQLAPLFACKRQFVQRRAAKAMTPEEAVRLDGEAIWSLLAMLFPQGMEEELAFAMLVMEWLAQPEAHPSQLEMAQRYAAWALYSEAGRKKHARGILFKQPKKIDALHLVETQTVVRDGVTMLQLPEAHQRAREGFDLTDPGGSHVQALDHAHYCIFCHHQGKDSCRKGIKEKDGAFKESVLRVKLEGCPLEEKISEMNELFAQGSLIGALAVVCIDNPMCAGTGHRICNDCMKSCIYQKQEPVNIPMVESRVLREVLDLDYGFEIYSLLTRWNPLNLKRPLPRSLTGKRVLVAGLGPAGYTLAHHLLQDGHTVVGIDGLKIEPLEEHISGLNAEGMRTEFELVRRVSDLEERLSQRRMAGFGGVAEYGITVRWDKNYLTLIRLLLERRAHFAMFGGVRFGGTLTADSAFAEGFDHVALCLGAGKPTVLNIPGGMARGVRAASDFLMALQLTGAAKMDSLANLQVRLPIVVVGGGLTAIDTATESLAYYAVQVEKFLRRMEALGSLPEGLSEEEREIAEDFISHAKQLRAASSPEARNQLLQDWGGVTIAYRKTLTDAPSYRLNHEEVEKAMEEGVRFLEHATPVAVEVDRWGHAAGLTFHSRASGNPVEATSKMDVQDPRLRGDWTLPARTILVAAGTSPNTVLAREDAKHFPLAGKYFQAVTEKGAPTTPVRSAKPITPEVLISVEKNGRSMSFFGDLHPSFAGNVVKAMASAKQGYPVISRVLAKSPPARFPGSAQDFFQHLHRRFGARVYQVNRLTPMIVEVVIYAPAAAEQFRPGQFYRLQNYEALAPGAAMEGLAMTGAWVDQEQGLVAVVVLEMGASSDLCARLKPGEPVVLMGPTGTPTEIPRKETVLLAGGGLGNAVLFSIGASLKAAGCKVIYFAGYRKLADRYHVEHIEAAADVVVWCCDEGLFTPTRAQDRAFHGNIVEAMRWYGSQKPDIRIQKVTRLIAIGSDGMMAAVAQARHGVLKDYLPACRNAIASINSPMQCMMKEICAQCLQRHVSPLTGKEHYVFSCFNQDQNLDEVDFQHLNQRLKQNSLQEKLTRKWLQTVIER